MAYLPLQWLNAYIISILIIPSCISVITSIYFLFYYLTYTRKIFADSGHCATLHWNWIFCSSQHLTLEISVAIALLQFHHNTQSCSYFISHSICAFSSAGVFEVEYKVFPPGINSLLSWCDWHDHENELTGTIFCGSTKTSSWMKFPFFIVWASRDISYCSSSWFSALTCLKFFSYLNRLVGFYQKLWKVHKE